MKSFLYLPALALLALACNNGTVYEGAHSFPDAVWAYRDTIDFSFDIADTTARYDMSLDFTHQPGYATQNLYARLKTRFPDGRRVTDVQSFDFFNTQGASIGKCSGTHCSVEHDLQKGVRFRQPGRYTLTLEQWMRRDSLPGLEEVRFTLKKENK
jgi:gliding motility-associated lipoprotein GldH